MWIGIFKIRVENEDTNHQDPGILVTGFLTPWSINFLQKKVKFHENIASIDLMILIKKTSANMYVPVLLHIFFSDIFKSTTDSETLEKQKYHY